eukprot:Rmarinus@m.19470
MLSPVAHQRTSLEDGVAPDPDNENDLQVLDPPALEEERLKQRLQDGLGTPYIDNSVKNAGRVILEMEQTLRTHEEDAAVCEALRHCVALRQKYVFRPKEYPWEKAGDPQTPVPTHRQHLRLPENPIPPKMNCGLCWLDGVMQVYVSAEQELSRNPLSKPPSQREFYSDLHSMMDKVNNGDVKSFCFRRMQLLTERFKLHRLINDEKEKSAQKYSHHRDFYNVYKADTHVHHSSCMTQKHLLRFIKKKIHNKSDEIVICREGKELTLAEVFQSLNLAPKHLSVDMLDMHADKNVFHRFDRFNLKYNPCGQSRLREVFLKTDNHIKGRYLAEITREVIDDIEESKYTLAEYRLSIYGRDKLEWKKLASWFCENKLQSGHIRWLIQVPRLYPVYKEQGLIDTFQDMLDVLFLPMFEATIAPEEHPEIHEFLQHVVGFDCVDDESKPERPHPSGRNPPPHLWDVKSNPPYSYYLYYIYANLYNLNRLREHRRMNTFDLRPHCGEAGPTDHLGAGYLLAHGVAHGLTLRKVPAILYLFYLHQVGVYMSPLSNNSLFIDYVRNPFPTYFALGLNLSISTDDPVQFHFTNEALLEEYSVAAQVYALSSCDLCELARNSILQSGFEHGPKMKFLGANYWRAGVDGNDIHKSNVPNLRVDYRWKVLQQERELVGVDNADCYWPPIRRLDPRQKLSLPSAFGGQAHKAQDQTASTTSTTQPGVIEGDAKEGVPDAQGPTSAS